MNRHYVNKTTQYSKNKIIKKLLQKEPKLLGINLGKEMTQILIKIMMMIVKTLVNLNQLNKQKNKILRKGRNMTLEKQLKKQKRHKNSNN